MNALNVIKEYLVSIGFDLDKKSFQEAESAFDKIDKKLTDFFNHINKNEDVKKITNTIVEGTRKVGQAVTKLGLTGKAMVAGLVAGFAALLAAVIAVAAAISIKLASAVAKADMDIQILARRLYTTTDNARSLKRVMDTMGVGSMEELNDVAFNPELRAQFLELRELSQSLTIGDDAQEGMKAMRRLGYEFQRLQLSAAYLWDTMWGKAAKFMEGPIRDLGAFLRQVSDFMASNAPAISDTLGQVGAVFTRLTSIGAKMVEIFMRMWNVLSPTDPDMGKAMNGLKMLGDGLSWVLSMVEAVLDGIIAVQKQVNQSWRGLLGTDKKGGAAAESPMAGIKNSLDRIYQLLSDAWNFFMGWFRPIRDWIGAQMQNLQGVGNGLGSVGNSLGSIAGKTAMGGLTGGPFGAASNLISGIVQWFSGSQSTREPGFKSSPKIDSFVKMLEGVTGRGWNLTSGVAGRSGRSNHPHGKAVDIGLGTESDESALSLIQAVNKIAGAQMNLEVTAGRHSRIMNMAKQQGIDTSKVSGYKTKDWTGDHAHINLSVNINATGGQSPQEIATAVAEKVKQVAMLNTRDQRSAFV